MFLEKQYLFICLIICVIDCHLIGDKSQVCINVPLLGLNFYFKRVGQDIYAILVAGGLSELKKLCDFAYTCFHDTVIICGKSVNEARTFLDLCDLYEYSCETNMVYRHVKEEEGVCPNPKQLGTGVG